MAILKIQTYGSSVLREKAKAVEKVTPELARLARDMLETMYDAPGIGLAAPQVGRSIRLIVVDVAGRDEDPNPYILFNPEILPSEAAQPLEYEEGCLSVPDVYANVVRPDRVTVRGLDEYGDPFELKDIDGLLARCFQHEVDHLEGVLFVDKISPEDMEQNQGQISKLARQNRK